MHFLTKIILFYLGTSLLEGGTPIDYGISLTGGYDNNAMRFSKDEFNDAAYDIDLMGGAKTFDSFVMKWGISVRKEIVISDSRLIKLRGSYTSSDYRHNPEKKYWSGMVDASYKWGPYRSIKYTLRHLNRFYLRHYVDRDISVEDLASCMFTDRNQSLTLTHRLSRFVWMYIGTGYLQRYYSRPFPEFDLDIVYFKGKLNYKLKNIGSVALQINHGRANNITYVPHLRPSSFDRSYGTSEWFLPLKINKKLVFFNEVGASIRSEFRRYDAEEPNDPLHAGRSHVDSKFDMWIKKRINDTVTMTLSSRLRNRVTDSEYEWVDDLKSFKQFQFWFKIEWDMVYDKY